MPPQEVFNHSFFPKAATGDQLLAKWHSRHRRTHLHSCRSFTKAHTCLSARVCGNCAAAAQTSDILPRRRAPQIRHLRAQTVGPRSLGGGSRLQINQRDAFPQSVSEIDKAIISSLSLFVGSLTREVVAWTATKFLELMHPILNCVLFPIPYESW